MVTSGCVPVVLVHRPVETLSLHRYKERSIRLYYSPSATLSFSTMSPELETVHKFKEALETGNFDLVTPFMLDSFTHEMFPKSYVRCSRFAGLSLPVLMAFVI